MRINYSPFAKLRIVYVACEVMSSDRSNRCVNRSNAHWLTRSTTSLPVCIQFTCRYLDPSEDADSLNGAVRSALAPEIAARSVRTVLFHMNGRYSLQTQSAQQNHCQWRFRGRTAWLAQLDLDEYLQPLGHFNTVADVLAKYTTGCVHSLLEFVIFVCS